MYQFLLIASGGAAGALSRHAFGVIIKQYFYNNFYSTFLVNIIGSFLIGYLISIGYSKQLNENFIKYFLIVGFLGSFTTFSTFSYEVIELFLSNKVLFSIMYSIFSLILCVVATYFGMYISKS